MKTLHLIRHAKSSWDDPSFADVERPLNQRGHRACASMASHMFAADCPFENIFCSIAQRAQMTIEGLSAALPGENMRWKLDEALYTFNSNDLLKWTRKLNDVLGNIVMVGHNPALTDFCNAVSEPFIHNIPTCGYVQLRFPIRFWRDLEKGGGKRISFLTPKQFG